MKQLIQLKSADRMAPSRGGRVAPAAVGPAIVIALLLTCFASSQQAQAVVPAPDGGYPGGNTAEQVGLFSLGFKRFQHDHWSSQQWSKLTATNTAIGAGALLLNVAEQNTATGAGALINNTPGYPTRPPVPWPCPKQYTGNSNTAAGCYALTDNTTGDDNTARAVTGSRIIPPEMTTRPSVRALSNSTGGTKATGIGALNSNTTGEPTPPSVWPRSRTTPGT